MNKKHTEPLDLFYIVCVYHNDEMEMHRFFSWQYPFCLKSSCIKTKLQPKAVPATTLIALILAAKSKTKTKFSSHDHFDTSHYNMCIRTFRLLCAK